MSTLTDIAARRRTLKLLPALDRPLPTGRLQASEVEALVQIAGTAPFHRPNPAARAGGGGAPEPWRFHLATCETCRALIPALGGLSKPPKKIANMLAAADALLLVTWLPEEGAGPWQASEENLEHIAAASAAVQTLLLAATEAGIGSYWSSGGSLATREGMDLLGVPAEEAFMGAIFLFPDPPQGVEASPGKMRAIRRPLHDWSRWIAPPAP